MLLDVVGCIKFYVKIWCGNLLLNCVKHGFYTSSLPNLDSIKKKKSQNKRNMCFNCVLNKSLAWSNNNKIIERS